MAVKNNNILKVQNYDPSYVDHLKKIQKSLLRPGKYVTELKISLEDLLNGENSITKFYQKIKNVTKR